MTPKRKATTLTPPTASASSVARSADSEKMSPKRTPKKKKEKKSSPPKEKRAFRFRSTCPAKLADRLLRASTQRLYLVERDMVDNEVDAVETLRCNFVVLGSTGNVYNVALQEVPSCTCPDYQRQNDLCKHILFVLLKVIGLSTTNPLAFQKAYVPSELRELFDIIRHRHVGGAVTANERVRQSYHAAHSVGGKNNNGEANEENGVKRRSLDENNDCPICFDPMTVLNETTYCMSACGANFHKDCIRRWLAQPAQRANATCPNCRQPWSHPNHSPKKKSIQNDEAYENFGALQGQSPVRDTSTYNFSPFFGYSKRRRWR